MDGDELPFVVVDLDLNVFGENSLFGWAVELRQIRVLQRLLRARPLFRVELQQTPQQIDRFGACTAVHLTQTPATHTPRRLRLEQANAGTQSRAEQSRAEEGRGVRYFCVLTCMDSSIVDVNLDLIAFISNLLIVCVCARHRVRARADVG